MRPVPALPRLPRFLVMVGASLLLPLAALSCAQKLPPSPIAVPLSDFQAAKLAESYLREQGFDHAMLRSIDRYDQGQLLAYQTAYRDDETPPQQWRVVDVRHDGTVREWTFDKGH